MTDVVRDSAAYRAGDSVLRRVEAAWHTSSLRAVLAGAPADRVRFWAAAAAAASATALALAPLGTAPRPLAWLVPAGSGIVSLLVLVLLSRDRAHRSTR